MIGVTYRTEKGLRLHEIAYILIPTAKYCSNINEEKLFKTAYAIPRDPPALNEENENQLQQRRVITCINVVNNLLLFLQWLNSKIRSRKCIDFILIFHWNIYTSICIYINFTKHKYNCGTKCHSKDPHYLKCSKSHTFSPKSLS